MRWRFAGVAAIVALAAVAQQRVEPATGDLSAAKLAAAPWVKRSFYGRRLEPRESVVLHGAGQSDETSFADYTRALTSNAKASQSAPMLTMSYVDFKQDVPAYFARLRTELARYPALLVPQIGLSMNDGRPETHYESAVAAGTMDASLQQMCEGLRSLERPAFLRIGYEFNGSWNGYEARTYVAAFRHVVGSLRACGLENVAVVWDWSVDAELDAEHGGASAAQAEARWQLFYPGDEWVDWWGLNLFSAESLRSGATQSFLAAAERRRFPVMIGESSPRGHPVTAGRSTVDAWFAPYFGLIRQSPGIRAFCYIDWDWRRYPQWAEWGDARVQDDAEVLDFYRQQVASKSVAGAGDPRSTLRLLRARQAQIRANND